MKTEPIVPARIDWSGAVPRAPEFDDLYHPAVGAAAQAAHVFLHGNGLPARWQGRARFVVLETGFGLGHSFLATWRAWRDDGARCGRLVFVSIEKHPPRRDDLARAHGAADAPASALLQAWPPLTPNLHALDFEGGRVQLLLALGDVARLLPQLRLQADAFFLDGFAPARNPAMWSMPVLKALGRLAAPGATAATWSVARELRDGLTAAGFDVQSAPGIGGKREITVARFAPAFTPRTRGDSASAVATGAAAPAMHATHAVVVGAGIAGAAVAQALRQEGVEVTVLERAREPAAPEGGAGSGNEGGLFHGSIGPDDGPHQRLLRAAALHAARLYAPAIAAGRVPGAADGLLWLDRRAGGLPALQALRAATGLPADYVQALDRDEASAQADLPLDAPAWLYPGGGWLSPRAWIAQALEGGPLHTQAAVHALARQGDAWQLLDADGALLAAAPLVVLANAADAARLVQPLLAARGEEPWPLAVTRGQVECVAPPPAGPRRPLTGDGYALTLADGRVLVGATRAPHEGADAPIALPDDRRYNLDRAARLLGLAGPAAFPTDDRITSRAGLRAHLPDRQPLAGPLHPALPGLFVLGALGARGLTLAPLLGRLVTAQALGGPWPLEGDLAAAVDPGRWLRPRARRAG